MAEFPALPLWTDAYLGDTTHLTTIEHGAYLLLLMTMWRTGDCTLPDDDRLLARYARCQSNQWKRLRPILEPFFIIEKGTWKQKRLNDERTFVERVRQRQSEKGKLSARAKALKTNGRHATAVKSGSPPVTTAEQPESNLPSPSPSPTYPEDKSSGHDLDPEAVMWKQGKEYLKAEGVPEAKAGTLLGKWRRDHGAEAVISALSKSKREGAIEPVAFIEGCLKAVKRNDPRDWGGGLSVPC